MSRIGEVLTVARKAADLTQADLAKIIGVTQATVNRYETGDRQPEEVTVDKLAKALGVTVDLLRHGDRFRGALAVDAHMRRQKTTKISAWKQAEARLNMLRIHSSFLLDAVTINPEQQIPTFDAEFTRPEDAARLVRAQWRMPIGAVTNLTRWLESAGCLVFEQDLGTHRIDGMSQWVSDHPLMLINSTVPIDRKRLTMAHELGHLALHSTYVSEDMEAEANKFAAEFLMPEAAIKSALRNPTIGTLVELKRHWGVSMQALFERARSFNLVTADQRTSFYRSMNARGWKAREPGSDALAREIPELPRHLGQAMLANGMSTREIAAAAGYPESETNHPFAPKFQPLKLA